MSLYSQLFDTASAARSTRNDRVMAQTLARAVALCAGRLPLSIVHAVDSPLLLGSEDADFEEMLGAVRAGIITFAVNKGRREGPHGTPLAAVRVRLKDGRFIFSWLPALQSDRDLRMAAWGAVDPDRATVDRTGDADVDRWLGRIQRIHTAFLDGPTPPKYRPRVMRTFLLADAARIKEAECPLWEHAVWDVGDRWGRVRAFARELASDPNAPWLDDRSAVYGRAGDHLGEGEGYEVIRDRMIDRAYVRSTAIEVGADWAHSVDDSGAVEPRVRPGDLEGDLEIVALRHAEALGLLRWKDIADVRAGAAESDVADSLGRMVASRCFPVGPLRVPGSDQDRTRIAGLCGVLAGTSVSSAALALGLPWLARAGLLVGWAVRWAADAVLGGCREDHVTEVAARIQAFLYEAARGRG